MKEQNALLGEVGEIDRSKKIKKLNTNNNNKNKNNMAYNMKNSALKMASKGSPMQKNYAGSPMKQDYTQQDTTRAIGVRKAELEQATSRPYRDVDYRPTTSEIHYGTNYKELLKETDAKTNDDIETYYTLRRGHKKNMKKKRLKDLNKKAVKRTKENTTGVIRGDKD